MKASKFSEAQIAFVLPQAEEGTAIGEVCRKARISEATFTIGAGLMPSVKSRPIVTPNLECAPTGGQISRFELTRLVGFRRMEAMTKHRSQSAAFKRQVAEEFLAGETLHSLFKRHDIVRQLIRIWVGKFEAGALDDNVQAADLIQAKSPLWSGWWGARRSRSSC